MKGGEKMTYRRVFTELQPRLCCQRCGEKYGDGVIRPFGAIKRGMCGVCGQRETCHTAVYFGYLSADWVRESNNNNNKGGTTSYAMPNLQCNPV